MELTLFCVLTCLAAGLFGFQGVQAARYASEGQNRVVAIAALVLAVAGIASFALSLGHPAQLFGAFGNLASGITLLLYAAVLFVAACAVFAVLSFRTEDGSVPAWAGVMAIAAGVVLALGCAFGYLTLTEGFKVTRVDGGSAALICYFVTAAAAMGAFGTGALGGFKGDAGAVALARKGALAAVALSAAAVVAYLVWFSMDVNAAAQVTKTTFDIQAGSFLVGGAVNTTTAAEKLAVVLSGASAPLFWGGAVVCGLVVPAACGALALVRGGSLAPKALACVCAVALVLACVGAWSFVGCLGVIG